MHYIDVQTAGQIFGIKHIEFTRLTARQDGRETSADGTEPEKTCMRQGGAISGAARRCNVPERP